MDWAAYEIPDLAGRRAESGRSYLEFLRVPGMSAGLYELPGGAHDPQRPHQQDEIYYVLEGRGLFRAGGETTPVRSGSVLYVRASVEHQFESIEEDLRILVVFAGKK